MQSATHITESSHCSSFSRESAVTSKSSALPPFAGRTIGSSDTNLLGKPNHCICEILYNISDASVFGAICANSFQQNSLEKHFLLFHLYLYLYLATENAIDTTSLGTKWLAGDFAN